MKKLKILSLMIGFTAFLSGCSIRNIAMQFRSDKVLFSTNVEIDEYFKSYGKKPNGDNEMIEKYKDYNVITILAESFDMKFTNKYLHPNLYEFLEKTYYFDNFYVDEVQAGATCNSEYVSLVGLLPTSASSFRYTLCTKYYDNIFPYSIPGQLRDFGYDTYYFHNGRDDFYNRDVLMPNIGFETSKFGNDLYDSQYGHENKSAMNTEYEFSDEFLIGFFEEYLDNTQKFYVDLLSFTMHGGYGGEITSSEKEHIDEKMELYMEDLGYETPFTITPQIYNYLNKSVQFDNFIGSLLDYLYDNNLQDKTIITMARDHHPYMLNPNEYLGFLNKVGYNMEEDSVLRFKNPYLIYDAKLTKQEIVNLPGTLIDIPPTLLNMLVGEKANYDYFFGNDMYNKDSLIYLTTQGYIGNNMLVTDGVLGEDGYFANYYELLNEYVGDGEFETKFYEYLETKIFEYKLQSLILENDFFRYI